MKFVVKPEGILNKSNYKTQSPNSKTIPINSSKSCQVPECAAEIGYQKMHLKVLVVPVARDGVLNGLGGTRNGIGDLLADALGSIGSVVTRSAEGVGSLLGGGLLRTVQILAQAAGRSEANKPTQAGEQIRRGRPSGRRCLRASRW